MLHILEYILNTMEKSCYHSHFFLQKRLYPSNETLSSPTAYTLAQGSYILDKFLDNDIIINESDTLLNKFLILYLSC